MKFGTPWIGIILLVTGIFLWETMPQARICELMPKEKAPEVARYIADLIIVGREIVARHQDLINDPSRGQKGFTPEYVERKILEGFYDSTGKRLKDLDPEVQEVLAAVLQAAKMSVAIHQREINQKGKGFKYYIPAIFGRETAHFLQIECQIEIKQTSFRYRNLYNQPDPFESRILKMFQDPAWPKGKGYGEFVGAYYRYLRPIYIKKPCLKCHGEPAGEKDLSGHLKEGYHEGDLRGAISISFPVK